MAAPFSPVRPAARTTALCGVLAALLLLGLLLPGAAAAGSFTFFEGTQYPLTVHFLRGRAPGPTVMVQGGIQGDEPAGYLTAQLLTRGQVQRGNLVIIPKANLPSIQARARQVNVDLNRRFDRDYAQFYEDRLARVIRFLLDGCDAFIHLHEGSGFYHPTYVDGLRNPNRYGQSIIIDTTVFDGRIHLAQAASEVLSSLNTGLSPADYKFQLFNTNTFARDTAHPEQRKSLTYYALSGPGIPAVAIEVSKNIATLPWKVRYQLRATELFLRHFGVEVTPPYFQDSEVEDYRTRPARMVLAGQRVDRDGALALSPLQALTPRLEPDGDHSTTLLEPSWSVVASDRPGLNLAQAPRMALSRFDSLRVLADGEPVGEVALQWRGRWPQGPDMVGGQDPAHAPGPVLVCWLNGELRFVSPGEVLDAVEGDQLILEGIWGSDRDEVLNLKGYVSDPRRNDGQDAGGEIILDPDNFIQRYFLPGRGQARLCRVARETPGAEAAEFFVRLAPRRIYALLLRRGGGGQVAVAWRDGAERLLEPGDYTLEGFLGNGPRDKVLPTAGHGPVEWGRTFSLRPGEGQVLELRQATTFGVLGRMVLSAPDS